MSQEAVESGRNDDSSAALLSGPERRTLLALAREAVVAAANQRPAPGCAEELRSGGVTVPRACFVTLRRGRELRGCIGQLVAREPLWEAVVKNAEGAAVRDHRFSAVTAAEVGALRIEISVLSPATRMEFGSPEDLLAQLRPGVDGVVLRVGGCVSTFLPQVWEDLPEKERFMGHLARKAGCAEEAWREPGATVERYRVLHFEEP